MEDPIDEGRRQWERLLGEHSIEYLQINKRLEWHHIRVIKSNVQNLRQESTAAAFFFRALRNCATCEVRKDVCNECLHFRVSHLDVLNIINHIQKRLKRDS